MVEEADHRIAYRRMEDQPAVRGASSWDNFLGTHLNAIWINLWRYITSYGTIA